MSQRQYCYFVAFCYPEFIASRTSNIPDKVKGRGLSDFRRLLPCLQVPGSPSTILSLI